MVSTVVAPEFGVAVCCLDDEGEWAVDLQARKCRRREGEGGGVANRILRRRAVQVDAGDREVRGLIAAVAVLPEEDVKAALEQLQAAVWPYAGPIGIIEENDGWRQIHVVDCWFYLGSLEGRRRKLKRPAKQFIDIDTYKILAKPMLDGRLKIEPCRVNRNAIYYTA